MWTVLQSLEILGVAISQPARQHYANLAPDRSHRLGKPKLGSQQASGNKPRNIVVKFISYRARSSFVKSKSKLKDSKFKGVFINEHLIPL